MSDVLGAHLERKALLDHPGLDPRLREHAKFLDFLGVLRRQVALLLWVLFEMFNFQGKLYRVVAGQSVALTFQRCVLNGGGCAAYKPWREG